MTYALGTVVAARYRLVRMIGRGGMAVVYEAEDLARGELVALKVLEEGLRRDPETRARFEREARASRGLPTSFVGRVHDHGVGDDGAPYLAMDLLRGCDLAAMFRANGAMPWDEAVAYVVQACAGLAAAHDAGIIHRDIKLANLFVEHGPDGAHVRVLDFGVSKDVHAPHALTRPASVLGTAAYMSPEQLRDAQSADARADVWSLGVVLHFLIAGELPMRGGPAKVVQRILDGEPFPELARPDVPQSLVKILARALDKDPSRRPSDARAFAEALAPYARRSRMVDVAIAEIRARTPRASRPSLPSLPEIVREHAPELRVVAATVALTWATVALVGLFLLRNTVM